MDERKDENKGEIKIDDERKIDKVVSTYFMKTHASSCLSGYRYSQDAVKLHLKKNLRVVCMCDLYLGVMDLHGLRMHKEQANLERCVRFFIERDWQKFPIFDKKPTNWQFITGIAEYISIYLL